MRLIVIVGPTASGKTALACDLAEKLGAEIVSADSQQCYRGLDAGTAKPTAEEQARARHHLLGIADPEEQLHAAHFVRLADSAIAGIHERKKRVIVAGGTGLWIRALLNGLVEAPAGSPEFRTTLRREFRRWGAPALHARLREVDPWSAAHIGPNDRVRIERALEVHALTGRPLGEMQREHGFAQARYQTMRIFIDPPREVLSQRIARRTRELFATGALMAETEWLLDRIRRIPAAARALKIIGYGECAEALRIGDFEAAERNTVVRTRQYAKRQRTWFAKESAAEAWPPDPAALADRARRFFEG